MGMIASTQSSTLNWHTYQRCTLDPCIERERECRTPIIHGAIVSYAKPYNISLFSAATPCVGWNVGVWGLLAIWVLGCGSGEQDLIIRFSNVTLYKRRVQYRLHRPYCVLPSRYRVYDILAAHDCVGTLHLL
jgi:hypothetical protein